MIPLSTFNLLVAVFVIFILYALIDYRNKFYANIISAVIASLIGWYLAGVMYLGVVEYENGTAIGDLSVALIILIPTISMMVYAYFMGYDAYAEAKKANEELR